nr:hypothetical protein [Tanacetum cinerariifolium]
MRFRGSLFNGDPHCCSLARVNNIADLGDRQGVMVQESSQSKGCKFRRCHSLNPNILSLKSRYTMRFRGSLSNGDPHCCSLARVNNITDLGYRQGERVPSRVIKDFIFGIFGAEPPSSMKGMISFGGSSAAIPFPLDSSLEGVGSLGGV